MMYYLRLAMTGGTWQALWSIPSPAPAFLPPPSSSSALSSPHLRVQILFIEVCGYYPVCFSFAPTSTY